MDPEVYAGLKLMDQRLIAAKACRVDLLAKVARYDAEIADLEAKVAAAKGRAALPLDKDLVYNDGVGVVSVKVEA